MSNTVKSKFAGLLRGFFSRKDRTETPADMEQRPVTGHVPDAPAPAVMQAASVPEVPLGENEIALPVGPVIAALPMDLRAKVVSVPLPGMSIRLSVDTVIPQLAFGVVKISFGELRYLAPGIFSNSSSSELDSKPVSLPLHEILPRINSALLARRNVEKVEVDEDIKGPFAGRGAGLSFTTQPMKAATPAPKPQPAPAIVPPRFNPPVIPNAPAPSMAPSAPIAFRPMPPNGGRMTPPASRTPAPNGQSGANGSNGHHGTNGSNGSNGHSAQHPPIVPHAPKAPAAPTPAPVPAAPVAPREEPAQPTIFAALWDLAESWPDELKDEISRSAMANASLPLAGNHVAAGLKRGRITMTWKEIRSLTKPSSAPSPNDGLELELPLKVITPLFFAAKKNLPAAKKTVSVSSEIPNLFFGFPQAAPAPAPTPVQKPRPTAPQPSAAPASAAATPLPIPFAQPEKKNSSSTNFYVWGDDNEVPQEEDEFAKPQTPNTDFKSRRAMPKEVVERAMTFRGVAGALVTLPDGLRVASNVPVEFNADTLAAFIPQLFERMNQSAKELRMGALNNVSFTVGNVPWRIFRVNAVYLAAFGRAGESLPAADLAALAGELDRRK